MSSSLINTAPYGIELKYLSPPLDFESWPIEKKYNYLLRHFALTITKHHIFHRIVYFLLPRESAILLQVCKLFIKHVEEAGQNVFLHIRALYFTHIPMPTPISAMIESALGGTCSWIHCLHEIEKNKSHRLLLIGGKEDNNFNLNRVDMMVIEDYGSKISWQSCAPIIKNRCGYSAYYCQEQRHVILFSSLPNYSADGLGSIEKYDVLSQTSVVLKHKLPINNLYGSQIAELNGKVYIIGGKFRDETSSKIEISDRVFCIDNKNLHQGETVTWVEQEARLITGRVDAATLTYQGKLWLAGGCDSSYRSLKSIIVYNPLVGSWQHAGNFSKKRLIGSISLFEINENLFAAGGCNDGMWVEKRDSQTGDWQLLSERNDGYRYACALAACGTTIYFLGGNFSSFNKNWNSFDTRTGKWAFGGEQYRDVATRQLPRDFNHGQVVNITPKVYTWTDLTSFL